MLHGGGQGGRHGGSVGDLGGQHLSIGSCAFHLLTALVCRIWHQAAVGGDRGVASASVYHNKKHQLNYSALYIKSGTLI